MTCKELFGKRLFDLRNKYGLSQNNVAQKLNVSYQAVSKWENGQSYPDIEVLPALAKLFNVSLDSLLLDRKTIENMAVAVDSPVKYKTGNNLIPILNGILTKEDSLLAADMIENGKLDINLKLEVINKAGDETNKVSKNIPVNNLNSEVLSEFSSTIGFLITKALNKTDYIIREMAPYFICPECKENLNLNKNDKDKYKNDAYFECKNGHKYRIVDGVIDFGSLEQHGNNWSNMYRRYEDYLDDKNKTNRDDVYNIVDKYKMIKIFKDHMIGTKPSFILEIGTGLASLAAELIKYIDWPCILLLNDISHRILKYDKRYFDANIYNPNVKIAYMACDARKLPIKDNVLNCVVSFGGYDNIMENCIDAIKESYRALKYGGYCVYGMPYVNDLNNQSTKKWIDLLKNSADEDSLNVVNKIHDIKYWLDVNKDIGFKDIKITKIIDEKPVPYNLHEYPYNYEVLRWTGYGTISAAK